MDAFGGKSSSENGGGGADCVSSSASSVTKLVSLPATVSPVGSAGPNVQEQVLGYLEVQSSDLAGHVQEGGAVYNLQPQEIEIDGEHVILTGEETGEFILVLSTDQDQTGEQTVAQLAQGGILSGTLLANPGSGAQNLASCEQVLTRLEVVDSSLLATGVSSAVISEASTTTNANIVEAPKEVEVVSDVQTPFMKVDDTTALKDSEVICESEVQIQDDSHGEPVVLHEGCISTEVEHSRIVEVTDQNTDAPEVIVDECVSEATINQFSTLHVSEQLLQQNARVNSESSFEVVSSKPENYSEQTADSGETVTSTTPKENNTNSPDPFLASTTTPPLTSHGSNGRPIIVNLGLNRMNRTDSVTEAPVSSTITLSSQGVHSGVSSTQSHIVPSNCNVQVEVSTSQAQDLVTDIVEIECDESGLETVTDSESSVIVEPNKNVADVKSIPISRSASTVITSTYNIDDSSVDQSEVTSLHNAQSDAESESVETMGREATSAENELILSQDEVSEMQSSSTQFPGHSKTTEVESCEIDHSDEDFVMGSASDDSDNEGLRLLTHALDNPRIQDNENVINEEMIAFSKAVSSGKIAEKDRVSIGEEEVDVGRKEVMAEPEAEHASDVEIIEIEEVDAVSSTHISQKLRQRKSSEGTKAGEASSTEDIEPIVIDDVEVEEVINVDEPEVTEKVTGNLPESDINTQSNNEVIEFEEIEEVNQEISRHGVQVGIGEDGEEIDDISNGNNNNVAAIDVDAATKEATSSVTGMKGENEVTDDVEMTDTEENEKFSETGELSDGEKHGNVSQVLFESQEAVEDNVEDETEAIVETNKAGTESVTVLESSEVTSFEVVESIRNDNTASVLQDDVCKDAVTEDAEKEPETQAMNLSESNDNPVNTSEPGTDNYKTRIVLESQSGICQDSAQDVTTTDADKPMDLSDVYSDETPHHSHGDNWINREEENVCEVSESEDHDDVADVSEAQPDIVLNQELDSHHLTETETGLIETDLVLVERETVQTYELQEEMGGETHSVNEICETQVTTTEVNPEELADDTRSEGNPMTQEAELVTESTTESIPAITSDKCITNEKVEASEVSREQVSNADLISETVEEEAAYTSEDDDLVPKLKIVEDVADKVEGGVVAAPESVMVEESQTVSMEDQPNVGELTDANEDEAEIDVLQDEKEGMCISESADAEITHDFNVELAETVQEINEEEIPDEDARDLGLETEREVTSNYESPIDSSGVESEVTENKADQLEGVSVNKEEEHTVEAVQTDEEMDEIDVEKVSDTAGNEKLPEETEHEKVTSGDETSQQPTETLIQVNPDDKVSSGEMYLSENSDYAMQGSPKKVSMPMGTVNDVPENIEDVTDERMIESENVGISNSKETASVMQNPVDIQDEDSSKQNVEFTETDTFDVDSDEQATTLPNKVSDKLHHEVKISADTDYVTMHEQSDDDQLEEESPPQNLILTETNNADQETADSKQSVGENLDEESLHDQEQCVNKKIISESLMLEESGQEKQLVQEHAQEVSPGNETTDMPETDNTAETDLEGQQKEASQVEKAFTDEPVKSDVAVASPRSREVHLCLSSDEEANKEIDDDEEKQLEDPELKKSMNSETCSGLLDHDKEVGEDVGNKEGARMETTEQDDETSERLVPKIQEAFRKLISSDKSISLSKESTEVNLTAIKTKISSKLSTEKQRLDNQPDSVREQTAEEEDAIHKTSEASGPNISDVAETLSPHIAPLDNDAREAEVQRRLKEQELKSAMLNEQFESLRTLTSPSSPSLFQSPPANGISSSLENGSGEGDSSPKLGAQKGVRRPRRQKVAIIKSWPLRTRKRPQSTPIISEDEDKSHDSSNTVSELSPRIFDSPLNSSAITPEVESPSLTNLTQSTITDETQSPEKEADADEPGKDTTWSPVLGDVSIDSGEPKAKRQRKMRKVFSPEKTPQKKRPFMSAKQGRRVLLSSNKKNRPSSEEMFDSLLAETQKLKKSPLVKYNKGGVVPREGKGIKRTYNRDPTRSIKRQKTGVGLEKRWEQGRFDAKGFLSKGRHVRSHTEPNLSRASISFSKTDSRENNAERKATSFAEKQCDFRIRYQINKTPPAVKVNTYVCSMCSFSTTRLDNAIRHYKDQCPFAISPDFFSWEKNFKEQMQKRYEERQKRAEQYSEERGSKSLPSTQTTTTTKSKKRHASGEAKEHKGDGDTAFADKRDTEKSHRAPGDDDFDDLGISYLDSDDSDDLPSPFEIQNKTLFGFSEDDVVWAEWKNIHWPALVLKLYPKTRKVSVMFIDNPAPKHGIRLPKKKIATFNNAELNKKFIGEGRFTPHEDVFMKAVQKAEDFLRKRCLGSQVSAKQFFEHYDEIDLLSDDDSSSLAPSESGKGLLDRQVGDAGSSRSATPNSFTGVDKPVDDPGPEEPKEEGTTSEALARMKEKRKQQNAKLLRCIKEGKVETHLLGVYRGTIPSDRHTKFNSDSLAERKQLKHVSWFGPIDDEEQQEEIYDYCLQHFKANCDYVETFDVVAYMFEVWVPEAIVKAISRVKRITVEEAEEMFAKGIELTELEQRELHKEFERAKMSEEEKKDPLGKTSDNLRLSSIMDDKLVGLLDA